MHRLRIWLLSYLDVWVWYRAAQTWFGLHNPQLTIMRISSSRFRLSIISALSHDLCIDPIDNWVIVIQLGFFCIIISVLIWYAVDQTCLELHEPALVDDDIIRLTFSGLWLSIFWAWSYDLGIFWVLICVLIWFIDLYVIIQPGFFLLQFSYVNMTPSWPNLRWPARVKRPF